MSTQSDVYERRRFTAEEYNRMLDVGILSPEERAILSDGFVVIPATPDRRLGPNRDPGPADATDPSDFVLMEPPTVPRVFREVSEVMNTFNPETQEEFMLRKFTVDEYYRMGEVGILSPDERTELLEGEIILMAAIGSRHAFCVNGFNKVMAPLALNDRAELNVQNPVFLARLYAIQAA